MKPQICKEDPIIFLRHSFFIRMRNFPPERIICLTEETVETLYLLGQQDRIVGVTGYAVRPPIVRKEKRGSLTFTSAKLTKYSISNRT